MNSIKTLTEAHNYLAYIADALFATSEGFSVDRQDKVVLAKYADDILAYSKAVENVKKGMLAKEQQKKKDLEEEDMVQQKKKDMGNKQEK